MSGRERRGAMGPRPSSDLRTSRARVEGRKRRGEERADLPPRGADTAATCGYADQAHFVRECQELCGQPPGAHLMQRAQLTGFFLG